MFAPRKTTLQEVHLRMTSEAWSALRDYSEVMGESSLAQAARKLLRERLTELGFLKERTPREDLQ